MRYSRVLLVGTLLASQGLHAETPVFRDQVLTIDEAVVFNEHDQAAYYSGIRMQANSDGSFSIVSAEQRTLAPVSSAEVIITGSLPAHVAVQVSGVLSIACVGLEEPVVTRAGNSFHVVLAETTMPPGSVCMSLVATTPYTITVPLDTNGLPAGNYKVDVNGKLLPFVL